MSQLREAVLRIIAEIGAAIFWMYCKSCYIRCNFIFGGLKSCAKKVSHSLDIQLNITALFASKSEAIAFLYFPPFLFDKTNNPIVTMLLHEFISLITSSKHVTLFSLSQQCCALFSLSQQCCALFSLSQQCCALFSLSQQC